MPTRVLVVANGLLARTGLATLLSTQPELDIVGQAADDDKLTKDLTVYRPDVVVYDLGYEPQMPTLREVAALPVVALLPDTDSLSAVLAALNSTEAEAYALLLRETDPGLLAAAVTAVAGGLVVFDPDLAAALPMTSSTTLSPDNAPIDPLTPRESEVLQLLAEGLPNKSIAVELGISANTVKFHVNSILSKLDVQSRTEAVVRATQLGLIVL